MVLLLTQKEGFSYMRAMTIRSLHSKTTSEQTNRRSNYLPVALKKAFSYDVQPSDDSTAKL